MMTISDMATEPRWLELIRAEASRTSIAAVAVRLDYSRTAISLVLGGKYPGRLDKVEKKAIEVLEPPVTVDCPHLAEVIPVLQCKQYSLRKVPTHNPQKMTHWRACQECQNRCKGES
jgi:hypothetical protein